MHTHDHHTVNYLLNRELTEIYITHSLRHFAISLVGIFVPIFLLERDFAFHLILAFYLIQSLFQVFLYGFFSELPSRIGVKHSILLSMPFLIFFFLFLNNVALVRDSLPDFMVVFFLAIIFSIAMFFYWFSFHVDFIKFSNDSNEGKQIGTLQALATFFSVLGPVTGGLIIVNFSFNVLFIITAALLFLSTVPLFFSEEIRVNPRPRLINVFKFEKFSKNIFFFAEGARQESALVFWPVFLFFISIQITSLGVLYSVTNLLLAIFCVFVGRFSDIFDRTFLMRIGSIVHAASLVTRTFFRSLFMIFSIQSIGAISFPFLLIPYTSIMYNKARKEGIAPFIVNREIFFHIGRISTLLICFLVYLFTSPEVALVVSIIFGSGCAIIMSFIQEDKIIKKHDKKLKKAKKHISHTGH